MASRRLSASGRKRKGELASGRLVGGGFAGCPVMAALSIHIALARLRNATGGIATLETRRPDGVRTAGRACSIPLAAGSILLTVASI